MAKIAVGNTGYTGRNLHKDFMNIVYYVNWNYKSRNVFNQKIHV